MEGGCRKGKWNMKPSGMGNGEEVLLMSKPLREEQNSGSELRGLELQSEEGFQKEVCSSREEQCS